MLTHFQNFDLAALLEFVSKVHILFHYLLDRDFATTDFTRAKLDCAKLTLPYRFAVQFVKIFQVLAGHHYFLEGCVARHTFLF